MEKVKRTTLGLREVLFDEIDALREGNAHPARVNALAKTAATILTTVQAEIAFAKFAGEMGKTGQSYAPLLLGSN